MWNVSVQRALGQSLMVEADYVGSRGYHLPLNGLSLSQLPDSYLSQGSALAKQVSNPFHGVILTGPLSATTVTQGHLYEKYPQYSGVNSNRPNVGASWYESLQLQLIKRYSAASPCRLPITGRKRWIWAVLETAPHLQMRHTYRMSTIWMQRRPCRTKTCQTLCLPAEFTIFLLAGPAFRSQHVEFGQYFCLVAGS